MKPCAQAIFSIIEEHFGPLRQRIEELEEALKNDRRWRFMTSRVSGSFIADRQGWRIVLNPECFSVLPGSTEWAHIQFAANQALKRIRR